MGIGDYYVDLTSENGCTFRQKVKVTQADPTYIKSLKISGDTVEILAGGGIEPYEYSIGGINYQSSNVFTNVPRGIQTAYVRSADNCGSASKNFTIYTFSNVITPNNDGKNDIFDLSILAATEDVSIEIYDRFGDLVFKNSKNTYSWDGKKDGKKVPTGTYWCIIKFKDPDSQTATVYTNWILLKNR